MIISLLSIYIATTINPGINIDSSSRTNSTNFENIIDNKIVPIKNPHQIAPIIEAKGVIALDLKNNKILFEKNANQKLPVASITKLMTILIVLEENQLNEIITVSSNSASTEGSRMNLQAGEEIAVENLIYGAIIGSANDAAVALAEHNAGSVDKFVAKMNAKASSLGMTNSSFSNPIGLDDPNNYSTAYEIAKLAKQIYGYEFIRHAASLKELEVRSVSGNYIHKLKSTNELLDSYLNIKGLKTGSTDAAGLCLVSVAENTEGNSIITVMLNSPARFTETKILIDWIFRSYTW